MASDTYQPLQGMSDLAPPDIYLWQTLEQLARSILHQYAFAEVRTPALEPTAVFTRSIGETTDVVQKEMYTFDDRGGRSITLRPEGTAGLMRFVAGRGPEIQDGRFYYLGPMFRSERPQAGRKRQFHQIGAETLGAPNPASDVECIALQLHLLSAWGLTGCRIRINTRGTPDDRRAVSDGLREAARPSLDRLCDDCKRRHETNPLRILDCKQEGCRAVADALPPVTDFMQAASREYLQEVLRLLKRLEIAVEPDPRLVRGLDYYVHTVWEITHAGLGAQDAISGGGRYAIAFGEKVLEGVGFAMGMERVVQALLSQGERPEAHQPPLHLWIVTQGDAVFEENLVLLQTLRLRGIGCGMDLQRRSMKAQMRLANRSGAGFVIIRGETEMEKGTYLLKDMKAGTQDEVDMPELMERLTAIHRVS